MKNLTTAIVSRFTDAPGGVTNTFFDSISGRLYERVPQGATWPYARYNLVSIDPWRTFTEDLEDIVVQFSLFSKLSSTGEIKDICTYLIALYDKATFSPTGSKVVGMEYLSGGEPREVFDDAAPEGEQLYWQTDVDFKILLSRN
jgi:hypothetical protein